MFSSVDLDDVSDRFFRADGELDSRTVRIEKTEGCIMVDERRLIDASLFA